MTPDPLPSASPSEPLGHSTPSRPDAESSIVRHAGPSVAETALSGTPEIRPHAVGQSAGSTPGISRLELLPDELLVCTLGHLATPDLAQVALASRRLNSISRYELILRALPEVRSANQLDEVFGTRGERLLRLSLDEQGTVFRTLLEWSAVLPGGGANLRQRIHGLRQQVGFDEQRYSELLGARPAMGTLSTEATRILQPYLDTTFDSQTPILSLLNRTNYTDPGTRACRLAYWLEQRTKESLATFLGKTENAQAPTLREFAKHEGQEFDVVQATVDELWEHLADQGPTTA